VIIGGNARRKACRRNFLGSPAALETRCMLFEEVNIEGAACYPQRRAEQTACFATALRATA
jgi:hypothetical protein